ncbi:MAG: hypothetical protein LBD41_04935 [Clostridiales Family XIII bacterium]|jgi:hypothetical protein|nr:hypothetical protein [Clostridiales Family XIII bacterium]
MPYTISKDYDYRGNWNRRENTLPRLGTMYTKNHEEILAPFEKCKEEMIHQVAESLALETWKDWSKANVARAFKGILKSEKYQIVEENLYGFGWYYFGEKKDHDLQSEVFDILWDAIQPEYRRRLEEWWQLHLQCSSVFYSSVESFLSNHKSMVDELYDSFSEKDFQELRDKENKRVDEYCAEESMWIKRSGGYRGD